MCVERREREGVRGKEQTKSVREDVKVDRRTEVTASELSSLQQYVTALNVHDLKSTRVLIF